MAEIDFDGYDPAYGGAEPGTRGPDVFTLVNWIGGLTSLALIGGMGYWGYNLLMRDVTGVPVVQALEGPIRVAPEDPGGTLAEYQGLSVNEVAGNGSAGDVPDTITLAPDAMALLDEDLPVAELPPPNHTAPADDEADPAPGLVIVDDLPEDALATDVAVAEVLAEAGDDPAARALALADAIAEGVAPLSEAGTPPETVELEPEAAPPGVGVLRSPRPARRPSGLNVTPPGARGVEVASAGSGVSADTVKALSSSGGIEIDVADIPAGTRLVQLGAFESAEVARGQWDKIAGKFEDYFEGKRRVVQKAQSGGKTFWRLRAEGFADLSDARRFCTALLAGQADCIPVVVK